MKAIVKAPGRPAQEIDIPEEGDLLDTVQGIVGGAVEPVELYGGVHCLCDEDGIAKGLDANCGLLGPLLFVADGEGTWRGLDSQQVASVHRWIKANE